MANGRWRKAFGFLPSVFFGMCFSATPVGSIWGGMLLPTAEAVGYANAAAMRLSPAGVSRDVVRVCRYAAAMV